MKMPMINVQKTGENIKRIMEENDCSVRMLQSYLGFNTPQAIYKWIHGTSIPQIDNIVILSSLFNVKIDDILVVE